MHPLVVVDASVIDIVGRLRHRLVERQVVGVGHPARLVRVVDVRVGEVARRPAHDLVADVILSTDDDRQGDENERRDVMV